MQAETIADRLKSLVPDRQKAESARRCGMPAKTFTSYLEGTEPTASRLVQLAEGLGVNIQWLATGEGPKFLSDQPAAAPEETSAIPHLDVRASAGAGVSGDTGEELGTMAFPRAWLRSIGVSPANARILTVSGDSMEPTLSSGDLLLVDISARKIKVEALYVLVLDDEVYVKRAQPRLNGSILITSDNDRYPPEEVSPDAAPRLRVAGRVVWFGRSI